MPTRCKVEDHLKSAFLPLVVLSWLTICRPTGRTIAKVLRTVGSAGSVHSPAGATSLQCVPYMGINMKPQPPFWVTFRCFETPAAVFLVCTLT